MTWYVGSIDQGTTSTRVILYNNALEKVASHQLKHEQKTPNPGWLQHDPLEILHNVERCIDAAAASLKVQTRSKPLVKGFGIANQRETVVVWDKQTGKPLYDAVVWCDLRSQEVADAFSKAHGGKSAFSEITGLPVSPYFSAFKLMWLIRNVPEVKRGLEEGTALIGTIDTWLLWKLTGTHAISTCNASRTYLMNIKTLQWSKDLCAMFGVPVTALPEIVPNTGTFGNLRVTSLRGVPVTGLIGDQHGACVGQLCFSKGDTKNTYGTGCFLLMNTGRTPKPSRYGLLTTICYHVAGEAPYYALEGSVVQAGMLMTWLKDNMGLVSKVEDVEKYAAETPDSGGVSIVPAFAGLFAPHWRADARGIICGLTMYTKKQHICRAALTSIAMQTHDVINAMEADSGITMTKLRADGGMTVNKVLMQLQADLAEIEVVVPDDKETTALGAGIMAALGAGCIGSLSEAAQIVDSRAGRDTAFHPTMSSSLRNCKKQRWRKAVERSQNWVEQAKM